MENVYKIEAMNFDDKFDFVKFTNSKKEAIDFANDSNYFIRVLSCKDGKTKMVFRNFK